MGVWLWLVLRDHLLLLDWLVLAVSLSSISLLVWSHVGALATLVVVLSLSLTAVVISLTLTSVLHVVLHATHLVLTLTLVHSVLHTLSHHILEEVLLDLLETSVLTLLVKLAAWHPVLH